VIDKTKNNRAWLLILPMTLLVAFSAIVPLMTVVNYSVQDILGPNTKVYVGFEWFRKALRDPELHAAFLRQLLFSFSVLAIVLALPLLIPWNVVGTIWQIFGRTDIGVGGALLAKLGISYNYSSNSTDAWLTVLVMDVWHWTPLVALLCYSGLRAIPPAYYQAASIDGASGWSVFRYIQLPKLKNVMVIAVLLRFMDSFMIYTEPFVVTGGGPGSSTTFLSQLLARMAVGQFDLGPAAAFSLIYFVFILFFCYVFYTVMNRIGQG
jgi:glycerol transport system permease protein